VAVNFVAVEGGRLAYERAGEAPPVVFLHGLAHSRDVWAEVARLLAPFFDTIRLDLRGHGAASEPEAPFAHHDDVARVLDALGLARAHVVGLSMGGAVAVDLALAHPSRVSSLALVDSALEGYAWSQEWIDAFHAVRRIGRERGAETARDAWADLPLFGGVGRDLLVRDRGTRWVAPHLARPLEPQAFGRLSEIRVPALVVVGERDGADFRAIARALAAGIAGARAVTLPGAGHLSPLEAPKLLADTLREFLSPVPA